MIVRQNKKEKPKKKQDYFEFKRRYLYETFDDTIPGNKSNQCKLNCIDQNKTFCATSNYAGGSCCAPFEPDCPTGKTDYTDPRGHRIKQT